MSILKIEVDSFKYPGVLINRESWMEGEINNKLNKTSRLYLR